ncbi:Armadillo-like helical domain containing protein [Gracilaria domingensis]|nr:Armadillo-like helical domain containing protein [Gracilaria domingensis]
MAAIADDDAAGATRAAALDVDEIGVPPVPDVCEMPGTNWEDFDDPPSQPSQPRLVDAAPPPPCSDAVMADPTARAAGDRALTILRRLTVSENCQRCIGGNGGIEAVVEIMRAHSLRTGIQTQGCLTLANLDYRNRTNKEAVMKCSGLKVVVGSLSALLNMEQIQAWGCLAIRNFTNRNTGRLETVQNNVLIALTNIASRSPYGMERLRTADGIQVLVSSLKHNLHSAKLAEVCMSLTRVVAEDDRNKELFGQEGGIQAMTAVMDTQHGHLAFSVNGCAAREVGRVVEDAFSLLRNLLDGVSQNQCNMMKHRGTVIVLGAACGHCEALAGVAEHSVAIFVNMRGSSGRLMKGTHEWKHNVGSTELRDWRTKSSNTFLEDPPEDSADGTLFPVSGPDGATNAELDAFDRDVFMKAAVEATNLLQVAAQGLAHALLTRRNGLPNARGRGDRDAARARGYASARRGAAAGPALVRRAPLRRRGTGSRRLGRPRAGPAAPRRAAQQAPRPTGAGLRDTAPAASVSGGPRGAQPRAPVHSGGGGGGHGRAQPDPGEGRQRAYGDSPLQKKGQQAL